MAKIVQVPARAVVSYGVNPTARFLLRIGVSPNAVTIAGTVGVLVGSYFGAMGHLFWATWIVTACALTDVLDGTMARMRGGSGKFGALLDSSMDRIADAAVFGAVAFYLAGEAIERLGLSPKPPTDERGLNEWGSARAQATPSR